MTWPFENDTSAITKKLAKKSLQSEKRRNLMVVIAVALAAFLICFTGIVSTSLTQMQRNQVVDTYEAVWLGVEENDIETLKGLPEVPTTATNSPSFTEKFTPSRARVIFGSVP
jgi:putative ABC transport system permease protein